MRRWLVVAAIAWAGRADAFERVRPMGLYAAGQTAPLAMVESRIAITVRGPIVETVVTQRFHNATGHATEATYIFPLPADAAVSALQLSFGARTIRGEIARRDAAQRRYEAAVAAGQGAALLEQERPDVFTQTVSAIPAGATVEVVLRYDSLARFEAGRWQLVVPMVVAPRYVPGAASGRATTGSGRAPDTDRAPDASRVTPAAAPGAGGSTVVAIHFVDEPTEVASPTHQIVSHLRDASLSDPHSDHDAIVRWRAAPTAGWIERDGDAGYAAVVVEAPPAARAAPVRAVLALDRSATTRGDADAIEHPVVRALLAGLERGSQVRVIGSDRVAWGAPGDALAALEQRWAAPAGVFDLTRALAEARPDGAAIVLVSDGLVADDAAAIAAARQLGVPVHVIGIGPAPARATLTRIAAVTGGTVRFAVVGDDVGALVRGVIADLATRPAPLAITWGTLGASEVEPAALPRLGAGQAMLAVARIKTAQRANARARGEVVAFEMLEPGRGLAGAVTMRGPLARRWARERLGDLLLGPHDREAVTRLALGYGLVSPYTSLIAIGTDVVVEGGVRRSVAVPVSVPAGMQWQRIQQAHDSAALDENAVQREVEAGLDGSITVTGSTIERKTVTPPPPAKPTTPAPRPKKVAEPAAPASAPADHGPAQPEAERPAEADQEPADAKKRADEPARARRHAGDEDGDDEAPVVEPSSPIATADVLQSLPQPEQIVLTSVRSGRGHRRARFAASLAGGLAIDHGGHGLAALDVRIETQRPTHVGGDLALWLVGGDDAQGRALLTLGRDLGRHLDLGVGAGVHFGAGTGPAAALRLGIFTPVPWLQAFLRYDAALLLTRPSTEAEHAFLLGLELSY
jgi:Ca-activated chloride channel family protein